MAIDQPDWLAKITCNRYNGKGHLQKACPAHHDATLQRLKKVKAAINLGKRGTSSDHLSIMVTHTIATATPVSLDTIRSIHK